MIIAEIGQNHEGNMNTAKYMIAVSKECGADLCKFQLFDPDKLYKPDFPLYKEVKQAELSFEQAKDLFNYGEKIGIEVFFSVFDVERVKWCEEIGVKRYKIACGVVVPRTGDNMDLIRAIITTGKPTIVSYSRQPDFMETRPRNFKTLYCVPEYPTPLNHVKFGEITFNIMDGFSDHTIGLDASKIALARGALIIEKHFALSHHQGVDAEWSMIPSELKELKRWHDICQEVL
jgi:N,N'-diacetyllegionaminate synthase